jgi:hypothetical protein
MLIVASNFHKKLFPSDQLITADTTSVVLSDKTSGHIVFFVMSYHKDSITLPQIEQAVLLIRSHRVMPNRDWAAMWRQHWQPQQGDAPQSEPVPAGFHVPTHGG